MPVAVAAKMVGHSVTLFTATYPELLAELLMEATHEATAQVDACLADRKRGAMPSSRDGKHTTRSTRVNNGQP